MDIWTCWQFIFKPFYKSRLLCRTFYYIIHTILHYNTYIFLKVSRKGNENKSVCRIYLSNDWNKAINKFRKPLVDIKLLPFTRCTDGFLKHVTVIVKVKVIEENVSFFLYFSFIFYIFLLTHCHCLSQAW